MQKKLKKKEINFLRASGTPKDAKVTARNKKAALIAIPVVLFIALLSLNATFLVKTSVNRKTTAKLNTQKEILVTEQITAGVSEKSDYRDQLLELQKQYKSMETSIAGEKNVDKDLLNTLMKSTGKDITLKDISYSEDGLSVVAYGSNYKSPVAYVDRLKKSKKFAAVIYNGFEKDEHGYGFTLVIVLS